VAMHNIRTQVDCDEDDVTLGKLVLPGCSGGCAAPGPRWAAEVSHRDEDSYQTPPAIPRGRGSQARRLNKSTRATVAAAM